MYILIAGGGKVGSNLTASLLKLGHEVTLVDNDRDRYPALERLFGSLVHYGDSTEVSVLERAGVERADLVIAVTGDDEDNLVACQLARDKYGAPKVIARVNDPRNQAHFEMLDINPTVSTTNTILALIEHELPQHELLTLLDLRGEGLEIVELVIAAGSPAAGLAVRELNLPDQARLISISRDGISEIAVGGSELRPGDSVLAILAASAKEQFRRTLLTGRDRPG